MIAPSKFQEGGSGERNPLLDAIKVAGSQVKQYGSTQPEKLLDGMDGLERTSLGCVSYFSGTLLTITVLIVGGKSCTIGKGLIRVL